MKLLLPFAVLYATASALLIPQLNAMEHAFALASNDGEQTPTQLPPSPPPVDDAIPLAALRIPKEIVPHQYIVVLKDGFSKEDYSAHMSWVANAHAEAFRELAANDVYSALKGSLDFIDFLSLTAYVGVLPPALLEKVRADPLVSFVEQDSVMHVNQFDTQHEAPWGLARVSQRSLSHPAVTDYLFDSAGGSGVTAYVVDTGIKVEHEDFEGRAVWGEAVAFPKLQIDAHGHGSHVAGTIGSKTYGIAKNVDLVAVGVMNLLGSGTTSDIIKGLEFAVNDHQLKVAAKRKGYKGATLNMLIGGGASDALDLAANAAVKAGVHVAVAAGNENQDACDVSPARAPGPITVGATDPADQKASFSNWGKCVDIQAPGVDILSVGIWLETQVMSGTSMATPHVTGLLSYLLSLQPELDSEFASAELVTPAELKRKFIKFGTHDIIGGLNAVTPNVLAYNGAGGDLTKFWNA